MLFQCPYNSLGLNHQQFGSARLRYLSKPQALNDVSAPMRRGAALMT